MTRVAEGSGVALLEEAGRIRFVRYAHEAAFVGAFFLGFVTLPSLHSALMIFRRSSAGDALLPLAVGVLTGIPFLLIVRHIVRGRRRAGLLPPLALIDFRSRHGIGEKLVLVKGDPFGGGVRRLVAALRERSLMR